MLKLIYRVVFLVFCLLPMSAYSSDLSRKVAEVQIKKAMNSIVRTASVREGNFVIYGYGWDIYQNLAAMGFITAQELDRNFYNTAFLPELKKYIIETSDLRTFAQGVGHDTDQRYTDNKVLLWKVKYNKVTGIKNDNSSMSGCSTQVIFNCNVEKSPFASIFASGSNLPDNLIALTACFSQYDDGWRLENLNIPTWVGGYDSSINALGNKTSKKNALEKVDKTKIILKIKSKKSGKSVKLAFTVGKTETLKNGNKIKLLEYTKNVENFAPGFTGAAVRIEHTPKDGDAKTFLIVENTPEVSEYKNESDEIVTIVKMDYK